VPTWLDEGMALVAEGQADPAFTQALQQAASSHHLQSIQAISGNFPDNAEEATVAYAESDSLVRYFIQTYGRERLTRLIAAFRQGATSDEAFQQSVGVSTLSFQSSWEGSLGAAADNANPANPTAPTNGSPIVNVVVAPFKFVLGLVQEALRHVQALKGQT